VDLSDPFVSTMVLILVLATIIATVVLGHYGWKARQARRMIYRRRRRRPQTRTHA